MDYVEQSHWDDGYRKIEFATASDRVTRWIRRHVPSVAPGTVSTAFEIGCFPGRYLSYIGTLGFELSGCDVTPRTAELAQWLTRQGRKVGAVVNADATSLAPSPVHDLVYSIGFIEHFEDYRGIVAAHDRLLIPGGTLLIACPNFRGAVQNFLHRSFDKRNLALHNVEAMDPSEWAKVLEPMGYVVEFSGFFGGFDFWTDDGLERPSTARKAAAFPFKVMGRALQWVPNSPAWSPYAGLVARKPALPAG
jgi:SAM-dependent methyltransferase